MRKRKNIRRPVRNVFNQNKPKGYRAKQMGFYNRSLLPMVNVLQDLPCADDRSFESKSRFFGKVLHVSIKYKGGTPIPKENKYDARLSDGLSIVVDDYVDDNRFMVRVIRTDKHCEDNSRKHYQATCFDLETICEEVKGWLQSVEPSLSNDDLKPLDKSIVEDVKPSDLKKPAVKNRIKLA